MVSRWQPSSHHADWLKESDYIINIIIIVMPTCAKPVGVNIVKLSKIIITYAIRKLCFAGRLSVFPSVSNNTLKLQIEPSID